MNSDTDSAAGQGTLTIVLEGGPTDLPKALRTQQLPSTQDKVKVPHQGGYEHFERDPDAGRRGGRSLVVFRWVMRTRVAE